MTATDLDRRLQLRLVDALVRTPGTESRAGRDALLVGIPPGVRAALNRNENSQVADLTLLVPQLHALGRLDDGVRPVVILAQNAQLLTRGTELGRQLAELQHELEDAYGDRPLPDLPSRPEVLVSSGTGEWVTSEFIEQARIAGTRVARLRVPRFTNGYFASPVGGVGTGWLIAPGLLLTNHHVIEAREEHEAPAPADDFARQGKGTEAWFDYHAEGGDTAKVASAGVLAANRDKDYALLRLATAGADAGRGHLTVAAERPVLAAGNRLNVVQCPGGGPLRYAIRNNFFVGAGARPDRIRYLTDTERGSSGAPVFDDLWQAVAIHRGHQQVDPELVAREAGGRELVRFHNEGILLADILADLPGEVRQEIRTAQGWS